MKKIFLLLVLLLLSGCGGVDLNLILVEDGDVLPPNICDNIKDRIIVIHKTGCPACGIALPILEEIEEEYDVSFEYYNTAVPKERDELLKLEFITKHVPALIYECNVYEGALAKENYLKVLNLG